MACYVEHAFPRASHFIWGRAGRAPEACCERLQRSLTQESSVTADSSPPSSAATIVCGTSEGKNKASEFRGSHAKLEPERNFAVGAGRLGSTAPQYSETYDALVEDRCGLQHEANRFPCTNEKTPQLALGSIDAATYYPDEDEGYTSATIVEELHSPAFIRAIHRSPDMAAIRRILESGEPVDDNESTRPPLIARLATTPSHSSHSSPMLSISRRQPGWHGPSSSSSAQTLDDVPRNCRKSQPKGEAKYTVKSSAAAAARARRHLLRPCASCAREAGLRRKKMELVIKEGWNNVEH
ncbi:hypothetical protein MMC13_007183 [Lambiella insularis]|nr:hypothetical protein [Lambiella insularis]